MKLLWTARALQSLIAIEQYVSDIAGEDVGQNLKQRLFSKAQIIVDFPQAGRAISELSDPQVRELIEAPYRIIYLLDSLEDPSKVSILGIVHCSQLLVNTPLIDLLDG